MAKFIVAISHSKGVLLCERYDTMDRNYFTSFIDQHFNTMFERSYKGLSRLWLQDGDLSQNSKAAREAIARCHSELFKIPPRSPDLDPIENIFHLVSKKLAKDALERGITRESYEQFCERVQRTICGISQQLIDKTIEKRLRENEERIPLVLTYHPLSSRVKHILLNNFKILTRDPVTATIFPAPPEVAHRRDRSLRDILVHTSDRSQTEVPGTFACQHPRCRTCLYTTSNVHVCGPKSSTTIRESFTCKSENVVYCISCRRCPSYTSGRLVVLYANDSANIFVASKRTLLVSRSQSTLTLPGIVCQTSL